MPPGKNRSKNNYPMVSFKCLEEIKIRKRRKRWEILKAPRTVLVVETHWGTAGKITQRNVVLVVYRYMASL
jgi:hypothetical protein